MYTMHIVRQKEKNKTDFPHIIEEHGDRPNIYARSKKLNF